MKQKRLSNSFSTGGGGSFFEANIQAAFVTLMVTGGHSPCLPCWPIVEIKLQGKIHGFDTDDLIVLIEDAEGGGQRRLLGQIKHSLPITKGSKVFGEVIQAAWNDFNNLDNFTKGKDVLALITGPMSAIDQRNVLWLLEHARRTKDVGEFYLHVKTANFSPENCEEKLAAIEFHLEAANGGSAVSKDQLYEFLRHFHVVGYDLDNESGVVLSLLHSHISQFDSKLAQWIWPRIVNFVQTWNKAAGTITLQNIPEDILEAFKRRVVAAFPKELAVVGQQETIDWGRHPDASYLALALLIGSWDDNNKSDTQEISTFLGISYEEWLGKARDMLQAPDTPLSIKNGIWKVSRRPELWSKLGSRILDQNLDVFQRLGIKVLTEHDPALELPTDERYAANIRGKITTYSQSLRKGVAEGLALVGSHPEAATNSTQGKAEATSILAVRGILSDADWQVWGSLSNLLPALAEAAPLQFIDAVESSLQRSPSPFDELFAQEGNGITGGSYLAGLLWALEGLAWDPDVLVRASVLLAELASHDPGGKWSNRPANSLSTILLPWLPQTLAAIEKRKVAVQTVLTEQPEAGWNLLLHLLPGHQQTSSGAHKPQWRNVISEDWESGVTQGEYWDQVSAYADLAVNASIGDPEKLTQLVSRLDDLPPSAFDKLLNELTSPGIIGLAEQRRREIWDALVGFTSKHRKFSDADWALPEGLVTRIEEAAKALEPESAFELNRHLFSDRDFDLYDENGDWQDQQRKLEEKRESAVNAILVEGGLSEVMLFAEAVVSARQVGYALGAIEDSSIDHSILPSFLNESPTKLKQFIGAFIWRRHIIWGWGWSDSVVGLDWSREQKARFLCELPFSKGTWDRATIWLGEQEKLYWSQVWANPYHSEDDLSIAVEKLNEYGRPYAAIECLYKMLLDNKTASVEQSVEALLLAVSSPEKSGSLVSHHVVRLIEFLQSEPSVSEIDLFKVEWAYLPLLTSRDEGNPNYLERKLAAEPEFFCELIRLIYRSKNDDASLTQHSESAKEVATNAWRLLHDWRTPPGMQLDGSFSESHFIEWLSAVKAACAKSGHLEVALIHVGGVLIHAPSDPDGLWIDKTVGAALNDRDDQDMRNGYRTAVFNSRGVHWVDPTGKPEKELADHYRRKADDVENAGFQRFAATLKELAMSYDREAARVMTEHEV
ncbi:hypothetical protein [Pseudoxanthomonas sacheonensis]|uniref:hypothetical protein n=1 Tax=Pseudoxanthomonas sacheonensis TaxID=443615 RepID=UPI00286A3EB7|nr:hypothetical protein [Pseudoxanthomonas sacheonensis]